MSSLQIHLVLSTENIFWQELIRRRDSEPELLCSAPGSYPNSLK